MAQAGDDTVELFTDGSCLGNPGPGGWGTILRYRGTEKELSGGEPLTTNNRMELVAVIRGLEALKRPCRVDVHTDSQYVQKGISEWMAKWKAKGWMTAGKKAVKNIDLWQELDALNQRHDVHWHWVKGHAGHAENERADALAGAAAREAAKTAAD